MLGLVSVKPLHVGLQRGEVTELFRTVVTAERFGLQTQSLRACGDWKEKDYCLLLLEELLLLMVHTWSGWTDGSLLG